MQNNSNFKTKLAIINLYQIIVASIGLLFNYLPTMISYFYSPNFVFMLFFISILLVILVVFFIFTNIYLLLKKTKYYDKFIEFNKWINFAQLIQFSIFGFTYYLVIGPQITPYLSYDESLDILVKVRTFNVGLAMILQPENISIINFGINIIPLIILYLILNIQRKIGENKDIFLDAEVS